MMKPGIEWQMRGEAFYFIADYHALTTVQNPALLREYTRGVAMDFLACGLDPQRAVLFRQSDVPEVTELAWLLTCLTPMPMLENCHAYKDHLSKGKIPSHGLFAYPVLMAADILLYDSNVVPVGRDQKQHVEVTRDLAEKANRTFGPVFTIPEASIVEQTATVIGLDGQKMSKSYDNTIALFEEEKLLRKKVMGIVTDSASVEASKDPTHSTIIALYRLFASAAEVEAMEDQFRRGGVGYGEFKKQLFARIWEEFAPSRTRRQELASDPGNLDAILAEGARKAREVALPVIQRVRLAMGLG
jgi:tryptophanyl-tRNA synthetase